MLKIWIIYIFFLFFATSWAGNNESESVNRILDSVGKKYAPDKRTALFDISILERSVILVLKGKTNLPEARQLVLDSLNLLKIEYQDSIIVLPDHTVGEKPWGLASLSFANMRSAPDHASELVSQALMGTPVKVLQVMDGWYYIQTPDLYLGWVDENGIALKTDAEMALWKQGKRFVYNQPTGTAVNTSKRNASQVSDLVLGDMFEVISKERKYVKVKYPDGRTAFVKKSHCIEYEEWIAQKPDVKDVLAIAKELLGSAYLWGGTSCKAVDCSGMIKTAWYAEGVILARDASQQAIYGEKIDFSNIDNLQPGDLLFFGRNAQRIIHVGIYMGNGRYIHASGLVRINSIDPQDALYNITERKKLVGASRIVSSLGTEGIIFVKEHGWY